MPAFMPFYIYAYTTQFRCPNVSITGLVRITTLPSFTRFTAPLHLVCYPWVPGPTIVPHHYSRLTAYAGTRCALRYTPPTLCRCTISRTLYALLRVDSPLLPLPTSCCRLPHVTILRYTPRTFYVCSLPHHTHSFAITLPLAFRSPPTDPTLPRCLWFYRICAPSHPHHTRDVLCDAPLPVVVILI